MPSRGLALAIVLLALPPAAGAQSLGALVGLPVVSVSVTSEGRPVEDAQARSLIDIREGAAFSISSARSTIAHLMGLGRYLDVRVHARQAEGGVAVDIVLVPLREQRRVVFAGDLGLPERTLRAAVAERFGSTLPFGRAADVARVLEDAYHDRGYLTATVRPRPLDDAAAAAGELVCDVEAGPQARIRTLTFQGTPDETVAALRAALSLSAGAPYEPVELRRKLDRFVADLRAARGVEAGRLRSAGYFEARATPFATTAEGGAVVDLVVSVTRGPLVLVDFQGDSLPERLRDELVPIAREGSADQDLIEDSQQRIRDYFRAQGYRDATVEPVRREDGSRLTIVFNITKGAPYRVASVGFEGAGSLREADLRQMVRIVPGDVFVASRLEEAVATLTRYYRLQGFSQADVSAAERSVAVAASVAEVPIAITFTIDEGVRTTVGDISIGGARAVDESRLRAVLISSAGSPFYPSLIDSDRDRLIALYRNLGYRLAHVGADVSFSEDRRRADLHYAITEGPEILVDHILVAGNRRIGDATILREVTLHPGDPLGDEAVEETQRRLASLGLFRRVTIAELPHGSEHLRDVLVTVEEAPSTTFGFGGGVEFQKVETSEFAPRGFVEVGRRNLWGKNRSVSFFGRLSLRRHEADVLAEGDAGAGAATTDLEYRLVGSYREPRVLQSRADVQVAATLEQGSRTSFRYKHQSVRIDLARRQGASWSALGQYAFERNEILDDRINPVDRPLIDRVFPQVRLSSVAASAVRDTRDDAIDPGRGSLVGLNGELALQPIGSEVGFAKAFLQGFIYRHLPGDRRIVFAGGARLGVGTGFPRTVPATGDDGDDIVVGPDGTPFVVTLRDLPISKRFFAGGDTTVRGFQLDRLGAPDTFDRDGTPIGGHAEIILNAELRVAVWRDVGVAGFLDVGNVFAVVGDVSVGDLRGGTGFGIRYKSPIGPIRVDFGFKLGTLRTYNTRREQRFALHFSIGQAF
ncbi:MAG: POTRA domain-containing protein [Acidobacteriota bacterium]